MLLRFRDLRLGDRESNQQHLFPRVATMRWPRRNDKNECGILPCQNYATSVSLAFCFLIAINIVGPISHVRGAITWTGSVDPTDPTTWTTSTTAHVGYTSGGMVTVDAGSYLFSRDGYLAYVSGYSGQVTINGAGSTWVNASNIKVGYAGDGILNVTNGGMVTDYAGYIGGYFGSPTSASGVVTVSGANSAWFNNAELCVGYSGNGTLQINSDGAVTANGTTYVSYMAGSAGQISFNGGTLTTNTLAASPGALTGSGTIITRGLVSDVDLTFDSTASLNRELTFNQQGPTVNLDVRSGSGDLGAGWKSSGSLAIKNGISLKSYRGFFGYQSTATGQGTVNGGSSWDVHTLDVGYYGNGVLKIEDGGAVGSSLAYIGEYAGSSGEVTVGGVNSKWSNSSELHVGYGGNGTLNIIGAGKATSSKGYIGYSSGSIGTVNVDGEGSTVTCDSDLYVGYSGSGTLSISNGGSVTVAGSTYAGYNSGATGTIRFGTGGGTLNTKSLWAAPASLAGTGTINAHGFASDCNVLFDSTGSQTLRFNSLPDQDVTVCLSMDESGSYGPLCAGWKGSGSLTIQNAAAIKSNEGYVGYNGGSTGIATVNGTGSKWTSDYIEIGRYGSGTLNITNGGTAANNRVVIGLSRSSVGNVAVIGNGSKWVANDCDIGFTGTGTLNISDGGSATCSSATLGSGDWGANGTVTVTDVGSTWLVSDGLMVGGTGHGTLNVLNGGAVVTDHASVAYSTWSAVTVDGTGSKWINAHSLSLGPRSSSGPGTLNITNGGVVATESLSMWNMAGLSPSRLTIDSRSMLAIHVGATSASGANGIIDNNGTVRFLPAQRRQLMSRSNPSMLAHGPGAAFLSPLVARGTGRAICSRHPRFRTLRRVRRLLLICSPRNACWRLIAALAEPGGRSG